MERLEVEVAEGTERVLFMRKEGKVAFASAFCTRASEFLCVCMHFLFPWVKTYMELGGQG